MARPATTAEQRAAEVRARRGPRPEREEVAPPPWEREQWQDDGPIRDAAQGAARRARSAPEDAEAVARSSDGAPRSGSRRREGELAPDVEADIARLAPTRTARYQERLSAAAAALDRGRYGDARRMVQPVLRDVPDVAFAHEIAGLADYRMGKWRAAAAELEQARLLDATVRHNAVLADCYRALRRYQEVETLWAELKAASPEPALMAEGRIVAAGALADRGDIAAALQLMSPTTGVPKKVREHHLRQWYVIADLYDRLGEVIDARRFFGLIVASDPEFADAATRLAGLGR